MRTLMIVKPDAVEKNNIGNIIAHIESKGFKIIAMKMLKLSREEAARFYAVHRERPFFNSLLDFMTSGYCVPMVVEGDNNVISRIREIIGNTDSTQAAEGTIRNLYGTNKERNAVHASDSEENAKIEIQFFFSERELPPQ